MTAFGFWLESRSVGRLSVSRLGGRGRGRNSIIDFDILFEGDYYGTDHGGRIGVRVRREGGTRGKLRMGKDEGEDGGEHGGSAKNNISSVRVRPSSLSRSPFFYIIEPRSVFVERESEGGREARCHSVCPHP